MKKDIKDDIVFNKKMFKNFELLCLKMKPMKLI